MAEEKILVVDDDADIREIITLYLEKEGYHVITAEGGPQALEKAFNEDPDLIILDIMLPELDGIEVCQEIRKKKNVPIILLSSKSTQLDKIIGLTAGGDDYITKPFDANELLARIKAHLRRSRILANSLQQEEPDRKKGTELKYPGLKINLLNHSVTVKGEHLALPRKEFELLALLAHNPGTIFSSEEIYQHLWDAETFGDHRTVMVHISSLRKKIEKDPGNPRYIRTVKGMGYKFEG